MLARKRTSLFRPLSLLMSDRFRSRLNVDGRGRKQTPNLKLAGFEITRISDEGLQQLREFMQSATFASKSGSHDQDYVLMYAGVEDGLADGPCMKGMWALSVPAPQLIEVFGCWSDIPALGD